MIIIQSHKEIHIPELEHNSGSWIISRKDGTIIGEFYDRSNVRQFNSETCIVETSLKYLSRINRALKES